MDPKSPTSFIPKQSLPATSIVRKRSPSLHIMSRIVAITFIIALVFSVGLFFYNRVLNERLATLTSALERAEEAYEPARIEELKRVNRRLSLAGKILDHHTMNTPIFDMLESETLKTVRYTALEYTVQGDVPYKLMLDGEARNFASVALQADALRERSDVSNISFINFNRDTETGLITFTFLVALNPVATRYTVLPEIADSFTDPTLDREPTIIHEDIADSDILEADALIQEQIDGSSSELLPPSSPVSL